MSDAQHPKVAQPDHDILGVIRARWSPRAFDPDRFIPPDDLWPLFEAARWAPSSMNEQPWRFVVADRSRSPEAFARLLEALVPKNQAWARSAPVLVLVTVRQTHERNEADNVHAWYDAGQAVAFLTLQATASGLSLRQMEGFDRARAREACRVPEPFELVVVMAVGYAGDPAALENDAHRQAEMQPRKRREARHFVYDGEWDRAFD
jgi:nitroreductase